MKGGFMDATIIDLSQLETTEARIWADQEHFLAQYGKCGTIMRAAEATNVSRETVRRWQRADKLGFADRFDSARERFREELEEIAFERLRDPQGNRGSDVLLITMLNAHWPEKYRRDAQPEDQSALRLMSMLRDGHQRTVQVASADSTSVDPEPRRSLSEGR
jgi:hypothetical protein